MNTTTLELTAHDPIIARDGRPFGAGQGNRMHSLSWPLPSVVAGSFRTALVKAVSSLDFTDSMPQRLMEIAVAGAFPSVEGELYLPAPNDAVAEPNADGKGIKTLHRLTPQDNFGGCDFPDDLPLRPVMLSSQQVTSDFKPSNVPAWWPMKEVGKWLRGATVSLDETFLDAATQETRVHVFLDPKTGTAAEGQIFSTSGLNVAYLPRFGVNRSQPFQERFADTRLSVRVTKTDESFQHLESLNAWSPLGGERRLVHWRVGDNHDLWSCPTELATALNDATGVRMVLATPAIFENGWRPSWLDGQSLIGRPFYGAPALKLVGVSIGRWKAVSGWSLAKVNEQGQPDPNGKRGPKPIRRMVPAGGVYFFEKVDGDSNSLATEGWLRSVSDRQQDRNDGFGLAVWGSWQQNKTNR